MTVTVRFWAGVKEAAGKPGVTVEGDTVASVREAIAKECPEIKDHLATCRFAVNDEFVMDEAPIAEGATVDVIPPVSGG
jgi:molybdopterin converting factor subunit 1